MITQRRASKDHRAKAHKLNGALAKMTEEFNKKEASEAYAPLRDGGDAEREVLMAGEEAKEDIVDFDPAGDQDNPRDWSNTYKWSITFLLAFRAFTVAFTCLSVTPIANSIIADLSGGDVDKSASVLLVTIWELGEACGPLFFAPLSELYGRWIVINAANVFFVLATALGALAGSVPLLLAARVLTGLMVTSNVLNPAVVGDMFEAEQRGSAMSLVMLAPQVGSAVGPAIAGVIAETLGWRAVVWTCVVLGSTCVALQLMYLRETYPVTILRARAKRLRQETGNFSLKTKFEVNAEKGGATKAMWHAVMRPAVVLAGSSVLQVMCLFGSLLYTYFYILGTTFPDILEELYGLSPAEAGSATMFYGVGCGLCLAICHLTIDRIYIHLRDANKGEGQPEFRLPLVIISGFTVPIVVVLYGWFAQVHQPVPVLLFIITLMGVAIFLGSLPLMSYVVDAFGLYSASAMSAVVVVRCLVGTFLPMLTEPMVRGLGLGGAFTMYGCLSLALAPIPVFVYTYGKRWRQRSKYTRDE